MTQSATVARRYARALLSLCEEQQALKPVSENLVTLAALLRASPELHAVAHNPMVQTTERQAIMGAVADMFGFHALTKTFLGLVTAKGRLGYLDAIAKAFERLSDERLGRVRAQIRSVAPLEAAQLHELKAAMEQKLGKSIVIEVAMDPHLLGGVTARVGDLVYDASLRSQLDHLKRAILGAN